MNWRIRLTWWDKMLLAIIAVAAVIGFVRFATGIGTIANINNAYPWGWWVGYGIMTMIAIGGVGFTITALVEISACTATTLFCVRRCSWLFSAISARSPCSWWSLAGRG